MLTLLCTFGRGGVVYRPPVMKAIGLMRRKEWKRRRKQKEFEGRRN